MKAMELAESQKGSCREIALALIDRVAGVIEDRQLSQFQRARSIAAATSSLNSSALCNAPLTISISRAAIWPAGSR